jgi:hypothetical protein
MIHVHCFNLPSQMSLDIKNNVQALFSEIKERHPFDSLLV